MQAVRIGVIGVGFMGTLHARAYAAVADAELVGVTDADADRAQAVAGMLGVRAYSSTEEMVADPQIQAVSVCTSDEQHVGPAVAALGAGKHVLLEKPIATTLEDGDTIITAAADSTGALLVGHILRFEKRYARAAQEVRDTTIGEVVSIYARRIGAASTQDTLKGRVSVLSFLGVHDFDICRWIAGSPATRVYAESRRGLLSSMGYDVEDQAFVTIRFESNVIACVEVGWVLPDSHPRRAGFQLEIIGARGVIDLDLTSSGISVCDDTGYRLPGFGHGIEEELSHFLACARGAVQPLVDGAAARDALEISLAAQQAASTGRPVDLPL